MRFSASRLQKLLSEARHKLAEAQKNANNKEVFQKLQEEGFLALYRSFKALPKNKALIKYLSEEGIKAGMLKTEEYYMANNNREMPKAIEPLYFVTDEKFELMRPHRQGYSMVGCTGKG